MHTKGSDEYDMVISGGGIGGLLLALGLKKHLNITAIVYEQAPKFDDGVGGAIGMYANGLRVIRDISPALLHKIRSAGLPYTTRTWSRHDGSVIATAQEVNLVKWKSADDEKELTSIGIRRYLLQNALVDACKEWGIPIVMNTRVNKVGFLPGDSGCELTLGSFGSDVERTVTCKMVFGCDGVKSATRTSLFGHQTDPKYTGVTCLMGSAPIASSSAITGINFPSSTTTKAHACYYPANKEEVIFQIYFPCEEKPETWKVLSEEEGKAECLALAKVLKQDGWHQKFIDPILSANSVLRVGLRARQPIPVWHAPNDNPRVVLLGDAAHPPVPYIGQGAMMAIEDVGILCLLLKSHCLTPSKEFSYENLPIAITQYEQLRLPRTTAMLELSTSLGDMQLIRSAKSNFFNRIWKEFGIWGRVMVYGTLPIMRKGSGYEYDTAVKANL